MQKLAQADFKAIVEYVDYEFQIGANRMLWIQGLSMMKLKPINTDLQTF